MTKFPSAFKSTALRVAAFAVIAGACASASAALPEFTIDPSASFTAASGTLVADQLTVTDYSVVTVNGTSFTESGYLPVSAIELGSSTLSGLGLNSTYGLYLQFMGTGSLVSDTFSTLTYTLYGYDGAAASFTPTSTTATGAVALATGSLTSGTIGTTGAVTFASTDLSVSLTSAGSGFFTAPTPFYSATMGTFINDSGEITPTATGFTITQGGGSFHFVSSVPEPSTYGLMLAGLGVVGFVARRRKI